MSRPHVIVVGAGIVGAAAAHALAEAGAAVTLLGGGDGSGRVTANSFGWVGLSAGMAEGTDDLFQLCAAAVDDWDTLARRFGPALPARRLGALVWEADAGATRALAGHPRAARARVRLIEDDPFHRAMTALIDPPSAALWAQDDLAVEADGAATMLRAAAEWGNAHIRLDTTVAGLLLSGGRVTGVRLADGESLAADHVLLAAGTGTGALLGAHLGDHPLAGAIEGSDALLMRFADPGPGIDSILSGPDFEVRPGPGGGLLAAELPSPGDRAPAEELRATHRRLLVGLKDMRDLRPIDATRVARPWSRDGRPIAGPVPGIAGLDVAVLHPGVILAPLVGRLLARAIVDGTAVDPLLAPFAPARFGG